MKKKYMLMGIAGVLTAATLAGGTFAALNATSDKAMAQINIMSVGVTIYDEKNALSGGYTEEKTKVMPGETYLMPRFIKNTEENGYDVYVKVVINKNWEAADGTDIDLDFVTGEKADILYIQDGKENKSLEALEKRKINDWIITYADAEEIVMFYTKPLAYNEATTDFISGITFDETMDSKHFALASYNLNYEVTAVQANNAKDAIAAELGMFATFDNNGNIVDISETR